MLEYCFPQSLDKYLFVEESLADGSSSSVAAPALAALRNWRREVRNLEEFGPVGGDTPLLVVGVRELARLRQLLAALADVAGVDGLLLVVSHAHYDAAADRLVRRVDYCMVLQIFYPQPVSVESDAERKHHWWWTANVVFEQLAWGETRPDTVLFIDESSYVLPDLMFVLSAAKHAMSFLPDAHLISLGGPALPTPVDCGLLTLQVWTAAHGDGLAFNRSTWERISALGWSYCECEEPSWSGSLQHLFRRFPGGRALAVVAAGARVLPAAAFPRGRLDLCRLKRQRWLFPQRTHLLVQYSRRGRALPAPPTHAPTHGTGADAQDVLRCYKLSIFDTNATTAFPEPD